MALGNPLPLLLSTVGGYEIERSLRFNSADSAVLIYTPGGAGDSRQMTFSFWAKRASLGGDSVTNYIWTAWNGSNTDRISFTSDDQLQIELKDGSSTEAEWHTDKLFRDVSAWYHVVIAFDTEQAATDDRMKLYINGTLITDFDLKDTVGQNYDLEGFNTTNEHSIGRYQSGSTGGNTYFNGYMTEIHFIDGTQNAVTDFGETDEDTGQWIPKKYAGAYGTRGFYLDFADNSNTTAGTLGKDSSGNGNNVTPNNFSVSAGDGNDSVIDTPTNNYCTWSTVDKHRDHISVTNGNLVPNQTWSGGFAGIRGTMGVTSGKWYFEFQCGSGGGHQIGWVNSDFNMLDTADVAITTAGTNGFGAVWDSRGYMYGWISGSGGSALYPPSAHVTYTNNDVIGCAIDMDNYKFYFSKNGTFINSQDPTDGTNAIIPTGSNNDGSGTYVAGDIMQPYFTGWTDGTGETNFGQQGFTHTPPAGYKALCTANLPEPTILLPNKHFDTALYVANAGTQSITTLNFQPDLVWNKNRDTAANHNLTDSVRGVHKKLMANITNSEADQSGDDKGTTAFLSNGFTVKDDASGNYQQNGPSGNKFVAWNWKESASAGFDIVSYTGNGQDDTDVAISHNLGVSPDMVIVKNRDGSNRWQTWHKDLTAGKNILLQTNGAEVTHTSYIKAVSSSTFTVRDADADGNANVNKNGDDYIAYCFASVKGYSKVDFYNGNNDDNGPFVYTGFKPAFVMMKDQTSAGEWSMYDSARMPYNVMQKQLRADEDSVENDHSVNRIDFLSNGFKLRDNDAGKNAARAYLYIAFAETPFKYANAR